MTAEQREEDEALQLRRALVQKMESYLRAHFDGKSAGADEDAARRLLMQVGADWMINRGLRANWRVVGAAAKEALARYGENWDGKEQGVDDRSHNFGRSLGSSLREYAY